MVEELYGKRVVVLGLARQGKALARFAARAGADVVVSDKREAEVLRSELEELADVPYEAVLGEHPLSLLAGADLLAISGGVPDDLPLVVAAREQGIPITNDS
ncbi:MAG: UDP-N-acetylmuramoyl-L-alanine--D-glutamate ligase, partial [Chloroflexota bacterium]